MPATMSVDETRQPWRRVAVAQNSARSHPMSLAATRLHGDYGGIVRWGSLVCLFALCLAVRRVSFYYDDLAPWAMAQLLGMSWLDNLLVALPVLPLVALAERRTSGMGPWPRNAVLVVAMILATLLGIALRGLFGWLAPWAGAFRQEDVMGIVEYWMNDALPCFGLATIYVFHARMRAIADTAHAEEMTQEHLARQGTEATLQALQAQIEPHFLFNTLANVRRLLQSDPAAGRAMLHHVQQYLCTSLSNMRVALISVAEALDLTETYLQIQAVRMGLRLKWQVEADATAVAGMLPPLMLMTLVENAIKHGLGPLPGGGTLHIAAHVVDDRLELRVSDDGAGFRQGSGSGTGLANLRSRLGLLYGDAAQLRLALNAPRGVVATLSLPYRTRAPT